MKTNISGLFAILLLGGFAMPLTSLAQSTGSTQYYNGAWINSQSIFNNGARAGIGTDLSGTLRSSVVPDGRLEVNFRGDLPGVIFTYDGTCNIEPCEQDITEPYFQIRDHLPAGAPPAVAYTTHLIYTEDQNFGIGTDNPLGKLHLVANTETAIYLERPSFGGGTTKAKIGLSANGGGPVGIRFQITPNNWSTEYDNAFFIGNDGKVGIGTVYPGATLEVKGDLQVVNTSTGTVHFKVNDDGEVYARQIEVLSGAIPDYVFENNYPLLSLDSLKDYIEVNKHLPNIPSAKEYCDKGVVNMGELQLKLLEKAEESLLYIIKLNEQVQALQEENKHLKSIIEK